MAYAVVKGKKHDVRVVQDLTENWSLEVFPTPQPGQVKIEEPFKPWPVPLCIKLRADSREHALEFGLKHMKELGKIDEFHLEPHEYPKADAPKKASTDDEEESEDAA